MWPGRARAALRKASAGKGRVHFVELSAPSPNRFWLMQKKPAMAMAGNAKSIAHGFDACFQRRCPRRIVPGEVERPCAALGNDVAQHLSWFTTTEQERQVLCKRRERVMQPPARGTTQFPCARADVIQNEDRDDRPRSGSRSKGGLIVQAQVLPEPNDNGRHIERYVLFCVGDQAGFLSL
jgi:hypothetical protein